MVERTVQAVKNLISKAIANNRDPAIALLKYNTTPQTELLSPSELLIERKLRILLIEIKSNFRAKLIKDRKEKLQQRLNQQKKYWSKVSRKLSNLEEGKKATVQQKNQTQDLNYRHGPTT